MNTNDAILIRMQMRAAFLGPRRVTRRKADLHASMAERAITHTHELGRPPYLDAPGFAQDRWRAVGDRRYRNLAGHEHPYGPGSRPFWREVARAMKHAFLAGIHDGLGTTYETVDPSDPRARRAHAVITGITS